MAYVFRRVLLAPDLDRYTMIRRLLNPFRRPIKIDTIEIVGPVPPEVRSHGTISLWRGDSYSVRDGKGKRIVLVDMDGWRRLRVTMFSSREAEANPDKTPKPTILSSERADYWEERWDRDIREGRDPGVLPR